MRPVMMVVAESAPACRRHGQQGSQAGALADWANTVATRRPVILRSFDGNTNCGGS